jgi:hypothetical protein
LGSVTPRPNDEKKNPAGNRMDRERDGIPREGRAEPAQVRRINKDQGNQGQDDEDPCVGVPGPVKAPLKSRNLLPATHDAEHVGATPLNPNDRQQEDPGRASGIGRQHQRAFHGGAPLS